MACQLVWLVVQLDSKKNARFPVYFSLRGVVFVSVCYIYNLNSISEGLSLGGRYIEFFHSLFIDTQVKGV